MKSALNQLGVCVDTASIYIHDTFTRLEGTCTEIDSQQSTVRNCKKVRVFG